MSSAVMFESYSCQLSNMSCKRRLGICKTYVTSDKKGGNLIHKNFLVFGHITTNIKWVKNDNHQFEMQVRSIPKLNPYFESWTSLINRIQEPIVCPVLIFEIRYKIREVDPYNETP